MKESEIPVSVQPATLAKLTKDAIMAEMDVTLTEMKPLNDQMVDLSLKFQAIKTEIYRRSIEKQLPGIRITRTRTILKIDTQTNPNQGLPAIAARLQALKEAGDDVKVVHYDENTGVYSFYGEPEFKS